MRFVVAIVTVPLVFVASLLGVLMFVDAPPATVPAIASAAMFALILLSPDTLRAVGRAGLALVVVGLFTLAMRAGARADIGSMGNAALVLGLALVALGIGAFFIARRMSR